MDNYKLEEVKRIIEENLLSPDVLSNILKSSTKRIENYDDHEAVEILTYLSTNETIPKDIKEELSKYLAEYNNYHIKEVEKNESFGTNNTKITIIYVVIIILLIISLYIIIRRK